MYMDLLFRTWFWSWIRPSRYLSVMLWSLIDIRYAQWATRYSRFLQIHDIAHHWTSYVHYRPINLIAQRFPHLKILKYLKFVVVIFWNLLIDILNFFSKLESAVPRSNQNGNCIYSWTGICGFIWFPYRKWNSLSICMGWLWTDFHCNSYNCFKNK